MLAVVIGLLVGRLTVALRERLDDPILNTTISFAVPFMAYFPAERVEASGVLAVVLAGLVTGAMAMGYQLPEFVSAAEDETSVGEVTGLVLLVLGLLVALRFLGLAWPVVRDLAQRPRGGRSTEDQRVRLDEFEEREPITTRGMVVIAWAGMRGVVTVAAVQTIPDRHTASRHRRAGRLPRRPDHPRAVRPDTAGRHPAHGLRAGEPRGQDHRVRVLAAADRRG